MENNFISFFIQRRKELGYSQSKIANELGISPQAVSNWERGITSPDLSYLSDIAKVLNTNVFSLIIGKHKNISIKENITFDVDRFSKYLLKLRKSKSLKQSELGKILGVPSQNISKFENSEFLPSIELLKKYAKYFNVSFLNIYYGLNDDELYENQTRETKSNKLKWLSLLFIPIFILSLFIIPGFFVKAHTVTIVLNDNSTYQYKIKNNKNIELPDLPTKKGYDVSWNDTNTLITSDKTFTVIYTPKKYTITYVFEDNIIESFSQTVTLGEKYSLQTPNISNYSFLGYKYNDQIFENGIYEFDYDITIYGILSNECYNAYFEFSLYRIEVPMGYGCEFMIPNYKLTDFIDNCVFSPNEYNNYRIIAFRDKDGNIYEPGNTYTYNYKSNLYLSPIFEYSGNAFDIVIENGEAKIIKYNISRITTLIIPDYIISNDNIYKVTEIAENTFQNISFNNFALSSNITKIKKNTFHTEETENKGRPYLSNDGYIFYNGSIQEWFNIDFEEFIICAKRKSLLTLYISTFMGGEKINLRILEIPEGVEVIKTYSCVNLDLSEIIFPSSLHTIEEHAIIYGEIGLFSGLGDVENVHENAIDKYYLY